MRHHLSIIILMVVASIIMMAGCTGHGGAKQEAQPGDTVYTQQAAMAVYDYQPLRALQIIDLDNSLQFVSDDNIGTTWDPYVIDLSDLAVGIRSVFGDTIADDSDWWTLQGFKIGRKPTLPGVYIHHGQKVIIKRKK